MLDIIQNVNTDTNATANTSYYGTAGDKAATIKCDIFVEPIKLDRNHQASYLASVRYPV